MADWTYPREWLRSVPVAGSGEWRFTIYVEEDGLPQTFLAVDPESDLPFEAVRAPIRRRLEASLDLGVYPPNHPNVQDLDRPTLIVRVHSEGDRAVGGPLGAPARLLMHTWRDLIETGLHETS